MEQFEKKILKQEGKTKNQEEETQLIFKALKELLNPNVRTQRIHRI